MIQSFMRHSCSKILVLNLLREEAERSLTAFVAGQQEVLNFTRLETSEE